MRWFGYYATLPWRQPAGLLAGESARGSARRRRQGLVRRREKLERRAMGESAQGPALPLGRFRVLDLTRVRSGPTCVRQFADWGAQVIKIEAPEGDGGIGGARDGSDFQNLHRNKRSLTLNLKSDAGRDVLFALVKTADVLIENFRPDVKHRLGIDYETMQRINPRLVYGSISGFGQDGPYSMRPGVDQIAQGMGGLMAITGLPGQGPVRAGIAVADTTAGMFCAMGILTALLEREVTGRGRWVQTSLLQAQIAVLDFQAARFLVEGKVPEQAGNDHPTAIPTGVFSTRDGQINLATAGQASFVRLSAVLGNPGWVEDERFATPGRRSRNRVALHAAISSVLERETCAHWIELLNAAGVPCGPIYRMDQVFADPQVQHLHMAQAVEHPRLGALRLVAQPFTLSGAASELRCAAPDAGQHSDEILRELGYDAEAIAELRRTNAI
jgi:crotonobetainyl-CoA:carnitine CoA-transferase CaiB-like acyl-CoA transferase